MVCPYCIRNLEHYTTQASRSVHFSRCKKQQEQRRTPNIYFQALDLKATSAKKAKGSPSIDGCDNEDDKSAANSKPFTMAKVVVKQEEFF